MMPEEIEIPEGEVSSTKLALERYLQACAAHSEMVRNHEQMQAAAKADANQKARDLNLRIEAMAKELNIDLRVYSFDPYEMTFKPRG